MIMLPPPLLEWIMRRFGFHGWTSLWDVAYIVPEYINDPGLIAHELKHLEQMRRDGKFIYMMKYMWWLIRCGYLNNPYEVEARQAQYEVCKK